MFRLIRWLFSIAVLVAFIWFGSTVQLGNHTLFGHIASIWHSKETQDAVKGIKDKAKPVLDKAKKVGKAAVDEARKP